MLKVRETLIYSALNLGWDKKQKLKGDIHQEILGRGDETVGVINVRSKLSGLREWAR